MCCRALVLCLPLPLFRLLLLRLWVRRRVLPLRLSLRLRLLLLRSGLVLPLLPLLLLPLRLRCLLPLRLRCLRLLPRLFLLPSLQRLPSRLPLCRLRLPPRRSPKICTTCLRRNRSRAWMIRTDPSLSALTKLRRSSRVVGPQRAP